MSRIINPRHRHTLEIGDSLIKLANKKVILLKKSFKKNINMRTAIILIFIMQNMLSYSQNHISVRVVKIVDSNTFIAKDSLNNSKTLVLNDTRPMKLSKDKKEQVIKYLEDRILHKEVVFSIDKYREKAIHGSILYNCILYPNDSNDYDVPCMKAKVLNVDMIRLGYIEYIGNNKFFKKLRQIKN